MDFSYIIPVHNCKDHLRNCVESILSCNIPNLEIILVDDGSTDGTAHLCDTLVQEDSRIRVIHQENAGVSAARNAGIASAKGEFILFADADDTLDSTLIGQILTDPLCRKVDLTLFGLSFDYYKNGVCYRRDPVFYSQDGVIGSKTWQQELVALYLSNSLSSVWNKIYRRAIIRDNQLSMNTDMFLYEDMEFVLRYLSCCDTIRNIPNVIYHYRQSEDEGNAGRRLSRINSISEFLLPIEDAFRKLCNAHTEIPSADCEVILQKLYMVLAREKIAVSNTAETRLICKDYSQWEKLHLCAPETSRFRNQLLGEQVFSIRFHRAKSRLRHQLAVFVKYCLHRIRFPYIET